MNLERVKAIIFDFDGTLVNSAIDFDAMKKEFFSALVNRGIEPNAISTSDTIYQSLARVKDVCEKCGKTLLLEELNRVIDEVLLKAELRNVENTTLIDGVKPVIKFLRENGYKVGILTRGSRVYVMKAFNVVGLSAEEFDAIICRDDFPIDEAKPNGIALKRIATRLGVDASECVMIGDHPLDLACAIDAKSNFIGISSGKYDDETWKSKGCSIVIRSVAELPRVLGFTDDIADAKMMQ
ncbi:MAG: HAD family hydrolase [Methanomassiliicoccales archaeon]|nr:HAD family hydrolase [Methanomassiliicoccales archaeon]